MNLLFVQRHLAFTRRDETLLTRLLTSPISTLRCFAANADIPHIGNAFHKLVFVVTSCNMSNSRYDPLPFHERVLGVDRFGHSISRATGVPYCILGCPHFGFKETYGSMLIREINEQIQGMETSPFSPDNSIVLTTESLQPQFLKLGFSVIDDSQYPYGAGVTGLPHKTFDLLSFCSSSEGGTSFISNAVACNEFSLSTLSLWRDLPEIPTRIERLFRDPLLSSTGSLTENRDYSTYSWGMSNPDVMKFKYNDIKSFLKPGRIVDEGCADGALLVLISQDFRDSDLLGIDIAQEFLAECNERLRQGQFRGTFVHFHQRNLMFEIFEPNSIDTTICNSTTHEIWSYGEQAASLCTYLDLKIKQLKKGGRLVIRDVVGPEDKNREVYMWCCQTDGEAETSWEGKASGTPPDATYLQKLSTSARFHRFCEDFLASEIAKGKRSASMKATYQHRSIGGEDYYIVPLKTAAEFMAKKDYLANWQSEMHEEFTFWSFTEWKQQLQEHGFTVIETEGASHAYPNPWVVKNRLEGKVRIFQNTNAEGPATTPEDLVLLPYPNTNCVLVAEKPLF